MSGVPPVGDRREPEPTTLPIPVQQPRRRRRRRWPFVLLGVLLLVAGLAVVGAVVGDRVFRQQAQEQIAKSVEGNLPAGVTGTVTATIDGDWVLPQYWNGSFDHVTLVTHGLTVAKAPARAVVQVYGLPVAGGEITQATADLTVGQAAFKGLPALRKVGASDPVLSRNAVTTTVTRTVLGLAVKVRVTLTPMLADQFVELRTKDATLIAGPISVPATAIVNQLLPNGVNVCAATYLPKPLVLTYLRVESKEVQVGLSAFHADLNRLDSAKTGHC